MDSIIGMPFQLFAFVIFVTFLLIGNIIYLMLFRTKDKKEYHSFLEDFDETKHNYRVTPRGTTN